MGSVSDLMVLMEADVYKTKAVKVISKTRSRGKLSKSRKSLLVWKRST